MDKVALENINDFTRHACNIPLVALSSTCFKHKNLESLCEYEIYCQIDCIELSGRFRHIEDEKLLSILKKYKEKIDFFLHHYFPVPEENFVLNLDHPATLSQSIGHCKKAIDICAQLDIPLYSVHASSSIHLTPDKLGKCQADLPVIDFDESRKIFIGALLEIAGYAKQKKVFILIENNIVEGYNSKNGVNECYHFADPNGSIFLNYLFQNENIGVLIDFAHLKVSAKTLGFNPFIVYGSDKR